MWEVYEANQDTIHLVLGIYMIGGVVGGMIGTIIANIIWKKWNRDDSFD